MDELAARWWPAAPGPVPTLMIDGGGQVLAWPSSSVWHRTRHADQLGCTNGLAHELVHWLEK